MDSDENRQRESISGDSEFEFGSLTPYSPSSNPCKTSPADKLFFNGRLQPHSFPVMFHRHIDSTIATSHSNSISSKDSLVSSRSNSTNSRSSARISSSDNSERRLFHNKVSVSLTSSYNKGSYAVNRSVALGHNKAYGCSRRWQYITPVPALNRDASKRRSGDMKQRKKKEEDQKRRKKKKKVSGVGLRFVWRILRWFVMTCRECHAMEPTKVKNQKIKMQKNVNM
ncbi:hypothetical protein Lal_00019362 [Lupinus albus]|nr:hypothetical protein Lal_00019362 [Lupinus albus]